MSTSMTTQFQGTLGPLRRIKTNQWCEPVVEGVKHQDFEHRHNFVLVSAQDPKRRFRAPEERRSQQMAAPFPDEKYLVLL